MIIAFTADGLHVDHLILKATVGFAGAAAGYRHFFCFNVKFAHVSAPAVYVHGITDISRPILACKGVNHGKGSLPHLNEQCLREGLCESIELTYAPCSDLVNHI